MAKLPLAVTKDKTKSAGSLKFLTVMSMIDYSVVSEFCRIERPTQVVLMFGQLLCRFLHFVQSSTIMEWAPLSWRDICVQIKQNLSACIFDFKEKIKSLI
jgi:hypothetical protein